MAVFFCYLSKRICPLLTWLRVLFPRLNAANITQESRVFLGRLLDLLYTLLKPSKQNHPNRQMKLNIREDHTLEVSVCSCRGFLSWNSTLIIHIEKKQKKLIFWLGWTLRPIFYIEITPNISARMSWSLSEILTPDSQSCIIRFKNSRLRLEFSNLIIHSFSFFKQYFESIVVFNWIVQIFFCFHIFTDIFVGSISKHRCQVKWQTAT